MMFRKRLINLTSKVFHDRSISLSWVLSLERATMLA